MKMVWRNRRWLEFLAFVRMVKHFNRLGQTLSLHSADSIRCLVIGRTSQRLEERIRLHVPVSFVAKATCHQQQEPAKKPVETKHTMVQRSQSRPRLKMKPQMTKPRMTELWKSASLTAALPGTSRNQLSAGIKSVPTCWSASPFWQRQGIPVT